ncbi:MAG: Helix-turn-helix domain [Bacteroidota bacterium]|jgi:transcriptional regulator with XRE-family HTH domain
MKNERLRQAREALGITQKEMAKKVGVVTSAYGHIESTESAAFSSKLMLVIAELGISINWIITGKGEMFLTDRLAAEPESDLTGELEERIRRIKIDVSDIEDTVRRLIQRRK